MLAAGNNNLLLPFIGIRGVQDAVPDHILEEKHDRK